MKVDRPARRIAWTPITLALAALLAGALLAGSDQTAQAHPPGDHEHIQLPAAPIDAGPSDLAGDDDGLDDTHDSQPPERTQPPEGERPDGEESDEDDRRIPNSGSGGDTPPDYISPSDHKMV